MSNDSKNLSWRRKVRAFKDVIRFRPFYFGGIIIVSTISAVLEGFGLSFILPIVEVAQEDISDPESAEGLLAIFLQIYELLKIPFTLESLVGGVAIIMILRYSLSFVVAWLQGVLSELRPAPPN
ncbi:hypothetical protein [Haloarcula halobia]|uniref:hypothetical protein n=1 Tax=Haloarcula halobia TaxID=3033388 RepID=UPI00300FBA70